MGSGVGHERSKNMNRPVRASGMFREGARLARQPAPATTRAQMPGLRSLVQTWIAAGVAGRIVCTIKFQGDTDHDAAAAFAAIAGGQVMRLFHNKHELTFVWARDGGCNRDRIRLYSDTEAGMTKAVAKPATEVGRRGPSGKPAVAAKAENRGRRMFDAWLKDFGRRLDEAHRRADELLARLA
jgi:hypothetical protein